MKQPKTGQCSMLLGLAVLLLLAPFSFADEDGQVYGGGLTEATLVPIVDLLADPDAFVGKKIRVKGTIDGVCPMRGCWLDIRSGNDASVVRFKVEDGEIEFPASVKGRPVAAEGVFSRVEMNDEQALSYARHMAAEQGREFDPTRDPVSNVLYRIDGTGAVVN